MPLQLVQLLQIVLVTGFSSHLLFNRIEPRALPILGLLFILWASIFGYVYKETRVFFYPWAAASLTISAYVLSLLTSIAAYRLSPWHPLARYPGPVIGKLTKWYMAWWIAKGSRHLKLQEWVFPYVVVFRCPNELSVDDPTAIKPIYTQMFRSLSYQGAPQDADALITTVDKNEHASRLVAWTRAFSAHNIKHFRILAKTRTDQLIEILAQKAKNGETLSFSQWISLWTIDVMGDMAFSGGFETLAAGKDTEGWMEVLHMGVLFVGVLGQVPWMKDILALAPAPGPILTFQK
ncbi:hypothetical protein H0H87_008332, partial [Tephrocybe sp. NHM501043]